MTTTTIVPTIEFLSTGKGTSTWQATTSPRVSHRAWDIIHKIQDELIEFKRREFDTVIQITTNPGVDAQEGLYILLTAVYVASINDLHKILNFTTAKDHLREISRLINYPKSYAVRPENIEHYLSAYISYTAKTTIKNSVSITEINPKYVDQYRQMVVSAKNRLEFAPVSFSSLFTKTFWERNSRLERCNAALDYLEKASNEVRATNQKIDHLRQEIYRLMDIFNEKYESNWLACGKDLQILLEAIEANCDMSKSYFEDFDSTNKIRQTSEEILAITPPSSAPNPK